MAEVTAQMVKTLREKTGAGISLCKEALVESDGDFDQAELYIRKKDKDKAAKKAERATGEGVVFVKINDAGAAGAMVEIACETDFAARNEQFQAMGVEILDAILKAADLTDAQNIALPNGKTIEARVQEAVATIGENMKFRRAARLEAPAAGGGVFYYRHFNQKAASLAAMQLEGVNAGDEAVQAVGRDVCMHVTSVRPIALTKDDIPADVLAKEKEIYADEVKGKPEEIQEKILQGKLKKFYATTCLQEQGFVKDDKTSVADYVTAALKDAGGSGTLTGFARLELGSGAICAGGELAEIAE
ncbi:MAG: translation elongation factor Ts [Planctomycetota bacterium]